MAKSLILGAAGLGARYGLFEPAGELDVGTRDVADFLDLASELGFIAVDTAPAYGTSEGLIGSSDWKGEVHTKLSSADSPAQSLIESKSRLGREMLDLAYLFHEPKSWAVRDTREIVEVATEVREHALAVGVSLYREEDLARFIELPAIDVVQIPVNLFNRGPLHTVRNEGSAGKRILGRSLLMQGLLLAPSIPERVKHLYPYLNELELVSKELGRPRAELAVGWVLAQPEIDGIILGARSVGELREAAEIFRSAPLSTEELEALNSLSQPPVEFVDPRNWS